MLAGFVSLTLGLGATLALLSYLVGRPTGPEFLFERISAVVASPNSTGGVAGKLKVENRIPSMWLIGVLVVGASIGGLGIALAQWKKLLRSTRIAQLGLISNVAGVLVWWLGIMLIDWTQYH
jgi:hypothetical protein